jgi:hypothetical protein
MSNITVSPWVGSRGGVSTWAQAHPLASTLTDVVSVPSVPPHPAVTPWVPVVSPSLNANVSGRTWNNWYIEPLNHNLSKLYDSQAYVYKNAAEALLGGWRWDEGELGNPATLFDNVRKLPRNVDSVEVELSGTMIREGGSNEEVAVYGAADRRSAQAG